MAASNHHLLRKIRYLILLFVVCLILSGITAFPAETLLQHVLSIKPYLPAQLADFLVYIYNGLSETNQKYPQLAYGYDWLAFAHIVIGIAFIGPYRDPVKNIWVIEWAMICCAGVIPLAFIAAPFRGIPFYWTLIDCSFGVFGIIPLWITYRWIKHYKQLTP